MHAQVIMYLEFFI